MIEVTRIAILGCGFMGTALLRGFLARDDRRYSYAACVRSATSLRRLEEEFVHDGAAHVDVGQGEDAAVDMASGADIVILGCAPGDLDRILNPPRMRAALKGKIVVSLLAGVTYLKLRESLADIDAKEQSLGHVRILPSLGAGIGQSVSLLATPEDYDIPNAYLEAVTNLFEQIGTVQCIAESLMAEATALGAVTHALSIVAVDTLADAAAAQGLQRDAALRLIQGCLNSASSLMQNGMSTAEMKNAMAIPGGITINSIIQLEKQARPAIACSALHAIKYTKDL